jgi:hypothetical protein
MNFELWEISVHILEIKDPVELVFVPNLLFDDFKLISEVGASVVAIDSGSDGISISIPRDSIGKPWCRVVRLIALDKVVAGEWKVRWKPESHGVLDRDCGSSSLWDGLREGPWL